MGRRAFPMLALAAVGLVTAFAVNPASANPTGPNYRQISASYVVGGVWTGADRNRIGAAGAAIDSVKADRVNITATPAEAQRIERLGYRVTRVRTERFPAAEAGLNADQHKTFAALGKMFAKSNGYTPEQSS